MGDTAGATTTVIPPRTKRRWVQWDQSEEDRLTRGVADEIMKRHPQPRRLLVEIQQDPIPQTATRPLLDYLRFVIPRLLTPDRRRRIEAIKLVPWLPGKVAPHLKARLQAIPEQRHGVAPTKITPLPPFPDLAPSPTEDVPVGESLEARVAALEARLEAQNKLIAEIEANYLEVLAIATDPAYKPTKQVPSEPDKAKLPLIFLIGYPGKITNEIRQALLPDMEVKEITWSQGLDPRRWIHSGACHYFCNNTVGSKWLKKADEILGRINVSKISTTQTVIDRARAIAKGKRA